MNYRRIYNTIIDKRKIETPTGYSEKHHIIPSSFGGTNDKENIIELTAREHFLCHYLLVKINQNTSNFYKAIHAFLMMTVGHRGERITSRLFEKYRIHRSTIMSNLQSGKNNSQFGTAWYHNKELKESKKFKPDDIISEGWEKGRFKKQKKETPEKIKICEMCGNEFKSKTNRKTCSRKCRYDITKLNTNYSQVIYSHSIDFREKMSKRMSSSHKGIGNPNYGKRWINNGIVNKTVLKNEILPEGFQYGMIKTW